MHKPRTLTYKLMTLVFVSIALGMIASWFVVSNGMKAEIDNVTKADLARNAEVFANVLNEYGGSTDESPISQAEVYKWGNLLGTRLTVIKMDGTVIADSEVPNTQLGELDNHAGRIEVKNAISTGVGSDRRYSDTTGIPYIYYAMRVRSVRDGQNYIIRCAMPMARYYALLSHVRRNVLSAIFVCGLVILAIGMIGVRRVTRPIRELTAATKSGDKALYPLGGSLEIEELSRALKESTETEAAIMDELQNERNQLQTVVRAVPCGLLLVDARGMVSYVNDSMTPLLRSVPDSVIGTQADGALRNVDVIELLVKARTGTPHEASISLRVNNAVRFYEVRAVSAGGREVLLVVNDVTERILAEEARKSFVADAGHEFQTPLTAISMATELLCEMPDSSASERDPYLHEIMKQRKRMTLLVDDLLLLSKLESGVPTAASAAFDFSSIVSEELGEAKGNPRAGAIKWQAHIPDDVTVNGRGEEIRRAVANLLDNAVKYTHKKFADSCGGEITVTLTKSESECRLTVTDNGVGIPSADVARIFGRFERVERDRARGEVKTGGYGLGLAIAKTAVESNGGRVTVGIDGGLTTFAVDLPMA